MTGPMVKRFAITILAVWMIICGLCCNNTLAVLPTNTANTLFPSFTSRIDLGYYQELSLGDASLSSEEGVSIVPAYLPEDLKVQEAYVHYHPEEDRTEVIIVIYDGKVEKELVTKADIEGIIRLYYDLECKMKMIVRRAGPPIRMGDKVNINQGTGRILEGDETQSLYWYVGRIEFILTASKDAPKEELIKVAESVS